VLHAYDASTLSELYNSNMASNSRDGGASDTHASGMRVSHLLLNESLTQYTRLVYWRT
jgi:hypothetical protein